MFKALRQLIKTPTPADDFEKCFLKCGTLLTPSVEFHPKEIQMLAEAYLNCGTATLRPLKLLQRLIQPAKDWVVHLKAIVVLVSMLRQSDCAQLPEYLEQYLSTCKGLQQLPSDPCQRPVSAESMSSQVYNHILLNLKSYGLKICCDLDSYRCLWRGRQRWPSPPAWMLFKAVNTCNYLLATKSTFSKLFKEFDPNPLFTQIFRFVLGELARWLEFMAQSLHTLLENSREMDSDELHNLDQLSDEIKRIYNRTNLMIRMVEIHAVPIQPPHLRPIRVPFEFKLSLEKNRNSSDSTKAGSFVKRVLQIDSMDRSFKEDELNNNSCLFSRSRKRHQSRSMAHTSMIMTRPFKEEL